MIEHDRKIELRLRDMIYQLNKEHVDVIVLGCTHYRWIEEEMKKINQGSNQSYSADRASFESIRTSTHFNFLTVSINCCPRSL